MFSTEIWSETGSRWGREKQDGRNCRDGLCLGRGRGKKKDFHEIKGKETTGMNLR